MSQTLKRGGSSAAKTAARQGARRKVRAARKRTGSLLDRAMGLLPLSERQLQRLFLVGILGGALGLAVVVASLAGVPTLAAGQVARLADAAGFAVNRVEVRGVEHMNELTIYERVLAARNQAMTAVDLDALRGELLQLSWVEDARVSRQLPNTLIVDIVERKPRAVLRAASPTGGDTWSLIDGTGHVLEAIPPSRIDGRLVLSGDGVETEVEALSRLIAAAPALQPQVAAAEWKGSRRWNLTFRTGQVLFLPEGETQAANALVAFARMDGANRLLGGRAVAFDMRDPDRIYIRVPGRAEASAKAKLAQARGLASAAAAPVTPPAHQENE